MKKRSLYPEKEYEWEFTPFMKFMGLICIVNTVMFGFLMVPHIGLA